MRNLIKIVGLGIIFIFGIIFLSFSQTNEEITVTTYYPSPSGSYNDLSTNIFTVNPKDAPPIAKEGRLYYNANTHSYFYYNGSQWVELGGAGQLPSVYLGSIQLSADYTMPNSADWEKIYGWTADGDYIKLLTDSRGAYGCEIDLREFGNGIYMYEWGGSVMVDGPRNENVQLRLQKGSWTTISYGDKVDDKDSPPLDGQFTTWDLGSSEGALILRRTSYVRFRLRARKSDNNRVVGVVKAGVYLRITRLSAF